MTQITWSGPEGFEYHGTMAANRFVFAGPSNHPIVSTDRDMWIPRGGRLEIAAEDAE